MLKQTFSSLCKALPLIGWIISISLVFGILALFVFLPGEPKCNGKTLSLWLQDFDNAQPEVQQRAANALKQIGDKAVPALVARLDYPVNPRNSPFYKIKENILDLLGKQLFLKVSNTSPAELRRQGQVGLDALGPAAKKALPALEKLLYQNPPDPHAVYLIARIGPAGYPLLNKCATNDVKVVRLGARACLDMIKSHSTILFPEDGLASEYCDFRRRISQFNVKMLRAANAEYRAQNPERFSQGPDGRPLPRVPSDFPTNRFQ